MSKKQVSLKSWLIEARRAVGNKNPNAPELIAEKVFGVARQDLLFKKMDCPISEKRLRKMQNLLGRLLSGKPLAQVLESTEFYNLKLRISKNVLAPRSETEELVEHCIQNLPNQSTLVDVGCGPGTIGLSIKKARGDINLTMIEKSKKALQLCKLNARLNNLILHSESKKLNFVQSNLLSNLDLNKLNKGNTFYAANLPYVDKNWANLDKTSLSSEPKMALFADKGGLGVIFRFLEQLLDGDLLGKSNWAILEYDPKQHTSLEEYCSERSIEMSRVSDYCTVLRLT